MFEFRFAQSTSDVIVHGVKACIYGEAGVGKTVLCATAPAPFVISAERGLLSLKRYRIPYAEVRSVQQLDDVHRWVMNSNESRQFATFCLDSVSEIGDVCLAAALVGKKDGRAAYGETNEKIAGVMRSFRDLSGPNVYFTAHADFDKDERTGETKWRPSLPGKTLMRELPYFFDELFFLKKFDGPNGQEGRALLTRPNNQYSAKDRSGLLAEWEPADLTHIFRKIAG
jgi:hypothetical protein